MSEVPIVRLTRPPGSDDLYASCSDLLRWLLAERSTEPVAAVLADAMTRTLAEERAAADG